MELLRITLPKIPPPKKNSRNIFSRGGKIFNVPSAQYKAWHEEMLWLLKRHRGAFFTKCSIQTTFYVPDKRRRDLNNMAASVNDLLVDAGILEDDNCFVLQDERSILGGVVFRNQRTEIEIKSLVEPLRDVHSLSTSDA